MENERDDGRREDRGEDLEGRNRASVEGRDDDDPRAPEECEGKASGEPAAGAEREEAEGEGKGQLGDDGLPQDEGPRDRREREEPEAYGDGSDDSREGRERRAEADRHPLPERAVEDAANERLVQEGEEEAERKRDVPGGGTREEGDRGVSEGTRDRKVGERRSKERQDGEHRKDGPLPHPRHGGMVTNVDAFRQCVDTRGMDANAPLRTGFAGLGTMGLGMARNLASKGFPLALTNRTMEKAVRLASDLAAGPAPVVALPSPAAVAAQSDVVVSCVSDGPDVEEIHLGPGGTIEGARPGTVVVDCSTIDPAVARSIAARLAEKGVAFLDAPVSGGQKGAIEGTLSFFVGGDAAALEKARPVFEAMGKRITHLGPSGAGQLGKATNQVIVAGTLAAVSEGMAFARAAGLPLEAIHAALTGGAANSWALEVLGRKMLDRDFRPAFAIKHQQKDLAIVLKTARANGVPLPATALVHQLLSALEAKGRGEEGTQALLTLYEELSR